MDNMDRPCNWYDGFFIRVVVLEFGQLLCDTIPNSKFQLK